MNPAGLLIEHGLLRRDAAKRFSITDEGRRALGPDTPKRPAPWVKVDAVSASLSRDVAERQGRHSVDDRTSWARSQQGSRARQKALQTTLANKTAPFPEWLRTG